MRVCYTDRCIYSQGVNRGQQRALGRGFGGVGSRFSLYLEYDLEVELIRNFYLLFLNVYYLPSEPPPRNRALAVHAGVDQSVGESAAKATGLARPAGTRVVPGDLTAGWQRCRRGAGGPAEADEHGQLLISVAGTPPDA